MATPPSDVTDTELAILETLWERGPSTVRQLAERIYPGRGPAANPTVQKLLARLEAKNYVSRDRSGDPHRYSATVDRGTLISARLRAVAEDLCGGSMGSLVTHLVQTEALSAEDRNALHRLVDEWKARKKPGDRRDS